MAKDKKIAIVFDHDLINDVAAQDYTDYTFKQEWDSQPYGTYQTIVNSCTGSILTVTSTGTDPMINMYNLGSFDPAKYKCFKIRYKVISGNAGEVEIFFLNSLYTNPTGQQWLHAPLMSDGAWHDLIIDASTHQYWTNSKITGWRFDWCTASGVQMQIDYIGLVALTSVNAKAFTVSGKELQHIDGTLVNKTYKVIGVDRRTPLRYYSEDFQGGAADNTQLGADGLKLESVGGNASYPIGLTTNYDAAGFFSMRCVIYANQLTTNGGKVRVGFYNRTGASMTIQSVSIAEVDSINELNIVDETFTPLYFGGSNAGTSTAIGNFFTDWANFTVDKTKKYEVTYMYSNGTKSSFCANRSVMKIYYIGSVDITAIKDWQSQPSLTTSDGNIYVISQIDIESDYATAGTYISDPIELSALPNSMALKWGESIPAGTSLTIETAVNGDPLTTPTEWVPQTNGEAVTNIPQGSLAGLYLWIRYRLGTTDVKQTPVVSTARLEEYGVHASEIELRIEPTDKFNDAVGNITIAYDQTLGNLEGEGGLVESFSREFLPTGLIPLPNPWIREKITAQPNVSISHLKVTYRNAYAPAEKVSARPDITLVLTRADSAGV